HLPQDRTAARFPQIMRYCAQYGLDITKERIPVSPAAHYMMGGVKTNAWGETNIRNLCAAGETACTGVHGANRLASNSLLETVVFAKRVINRTLDPERRPTASDPAAIRLPEPASEARLGAPERREGDSTARSGASTPSLHLSEQGLSLANLQTLMWDRVGIVRDGDGLAEAALTLALWQSSMPEPHDRPSQELANLLLAGRLATEGALVRQESRGAHYRTDFPGPDDAWLKHIVFRNDA